MPVPDFFDTNEYYCIATRYAHTVLWYKIVKSVLNCTVGTTYIQLHTDLCVCACAYKNLFTLEVFCVHVICYLLGWQTLALPWTFSPSLTTNFGKRGLSYQILCNRSCQIKENLFLGPVIMLIPHLNCFWRWFLSPPLQLEHQHCH